MDCAAWLFTQFNYGIILFISGECVWFTLDLIREVLDNCRTLFPVSTYAYVTIPSYPCGQIGFVLSSKSQVSVG